MMTRNQKFCLLISLYIAQGLPYGFFTQTLPVLLRVEDVDLKTIGFSSVLALPWALKFLWAPAVDKFGSRKLWILWSNLIAISCLMAMSFIELPFIVNDAIIILFGGFFLMNLFTATQDIATDGMAINLLTEDERGIGNGIQVAGYRVGMILGGGLLLSWFAVLGWQYSLWILSAIFFVTTLPVIFSKKNVHTVNKNDLSFTDFIAFFKSPHLGLWLVIIVIYKFGDALGGAMVRPLLVDSGLSIKDIALILGVAGFSAGLLGAVVGGLLVNKLGRFRALLIFGIIQAFAVATWAIIPMGIVSKPVIYLLSALEHFTGGLATAALFTAMMDHCRKQCAGSDYTIQACIVVTMTILASTLSGISATEIGYQWHFILAGILSLSVFPLIFSYKPHFVS
ncbi:MAG: MFS transporter [Kangiellaceae bacterium]|nr:MFS transporter [Kangiellaceae bacterium]